MAGHSHWSSIKRKKAAVDAKRGKAFSKAAKAITVAARQGGGDPDMNLSLRYALDKAKEINMPNDNIERAIKKGTGDLPGQGSIEQVVYEAYLPGGVAVMVDSLTDNRNRTASEVRNMIEKAGGSLAAANAVAHMFERCGIINVSQEAADEERVMEVALDAGAEDIVPQDDEVFEVRTTPEAFEGVLAAFNEAGIKTETAQVELVPHTTVPLDADMARKVLGLVEQLEDLDDVNEVYANFDVSDEVMHEVAED